jgi:hypothetical protein
VQRIQDRRQLAVEADIDNRADDLGDRTDAVRCRAGSHVLNPVSAKLHCQTL